MFQFSVLTRAERDAMGYDEYSPIKMKGSNLSDAGEIGYMVVDALDTILIMGLEEEYARARDWVANKMSFNHNGTYNTFEVCFCSTLCCRFSDLTRSPFGSLAASSLLIISLVKTPSSSNAPSSSLIAFFLHLTRSLDCH
jgi:hypothetical protein